MWISYGICILFSVGILFIWLTCKLSVANQHIPSSFLKSTSTQTEVQTFRLPLSEPTPINKTI